MASRAAKRSRIDKANSKDAKVSPSPRRSLGQIVLSGADVVSVVWRMLNFADWIEFRCVNKALRSLSNGKLRELGDPMQPVPAPAPSAPSSTSSTADKQQDEPVAVPVKRTLMERERQALLTLAETNLYRLHRRPETSLAQLIRICYVTNEYVANANGGYISAWNHDMDLRRVWLCRSCCKLRWTTDITNRDREHIALFGHVICKDCENTRPFRLYTAADAKKFFGLTAKDFRRFGVARYHQRGAYTYANRAQVRLVLVKKHGKISQQVKDFDEFAG